MKKCLLCGIRLRDTAPNPYCAGPKGVKACGERIERVRRREHGKWKRAGAVVDSVTVCGGYHKFDASKDIDHVGDQNNGKRAARAERTIAAYRETDRDDGINDEVITDCICDILHLCDREELDITEMIRTAVNRHSEERGE